MKPRKTTDLQKALEKKGFVRDPNTEHHLTYHLTTGNGQRGPIRTRLSHGIKEYGPQLMQRVKKQLQFPDTPSAERFFDCPMDHAEYVALLHQTGALQK